MKNIETEFEKYNSTISIIRMTNENILKETHKLLNPQKIYDSLLYFYVEWKYTTWFKIDDKIISDILGIPDFNFFFFCLIDEPQFINKSKILELVFKFGNLKHLQILHYLNFEFCISDLFRSLKYRIEFSKFIADKLELTEKHMLSMMNNCPFWKFKIIYKYNYKTKMENTFLIEKARKMNSNRYLKLFQ